MLPGIHNDYVVHSVCFIVFCTQILSNEERRSNFDRYGQTDDSQPFGHSQHQGFRGSHNSFYFDESFFHFPRYRFRFVLSNIEVVVPCLLYRLSRVCEDTIVKENQTGKLEALLLLFRILSKALFF